MSKTLLSALVAVICLSLFTACERESSLDVNQDKIYMDYELFYNSNTDKTWVVARFRFGGPTGTLLELEDPAFVVFDQDTLAYNVLVGGHFKEYAGQLTTGDFSYTDAEGITYNNTVPAYEAIQFPSDFDTLSRSEAYSLAWEGTALSADQRVGLFIGSWTWGDDALSIQTADGATDVVLGTEQLDNLPLGPSTCFMDRSKDVAVSEGTSEGGRIRGKYRAMNQQITVVE